MPLLIQMEAKLMLVKDKLALDEKLRRLGYDTTLFRLSKRDGGDAVAVLRKEAIGKWVEKMLVKLSG